MEIDLDVHKHVPWYLPVLIGEVLAADGYVDLRRRLRSLLPELKAQAAAYWDNHEPYTAKRSAPELGLHLHGGLDILGDTGVCRAFRCRMAASDRLVRSVGVFADVVWISDTLTWQLLDFGRATNEKLHALAEDALVLANIFPLIATGIVRFRPSAFLACAGCSAHLAKQVDDAVDLVYPMFSDAMTVHEEVGGVYVDTGEAYDPPLHIIFKNGAVGDKDIILKSAFRSELRSALFITQELQLLGGALFSNSRVALSGLFALRRASGSDGDALDLPWLSELSARQVVELRQEASSALPAFRETMASILAVSGHSSESSEGGYARIDELRERSIQVRQELEGIAKSSERFWRTAYTVLGLSASAYGLMSQNPAAALSGLLPIIQNLLSHKSGLPVDREKLLRDPAFVFVKAQDLLAHA
jgi:hypothetical protein